MKLPRAGLVLCGVGLLLAAGCDNVNTPPTATAVARAAAIEDAAIGQSHWAGQPAPDFTLPDVDGNPVTLSKLRGQWVVLYFYPKDDSPGCNCDVTRYTKLVIDFRDLKAATYGISLLSSRNNRVIVEEYKVAMTLLSDKEHKVIESYGLWLKPKPGDKRNPEGVGDRSTFIIDPAGIVRYHWPTVIPAGHVTRVRQKLTELQAAKANP